MTVFLLSVSFVGTVGAVEHNHNDLTFTSWNTADSLPSSAGNYYLDTDVNLPNTWDVPVGTVNLCLNGHVINLSLPSGVKGSVINVSSGAIFNLYDCDDTQKHYFDVDPSNGKWIYNKDATSGEQYVVGGVITGGSGTTPSDMRNKKCGGGVYVGKSSYFTMFGGNIVGNSAGTTWDDGGGGILVRNNATFTMYGGSISHNTGTAGGGIYARGSGVLWEGDVYYAKVYLYGGIISHNEATAGNGGGVYGGNDAEIHVFDGCTISNNHAKVKGGGIALRYYGKLYMSGGTISENTALGTGGGGVYVDTAGGCSINLGGDKSGTVTIMGNTFNQNPNNVHLAGSNVITINSPLSTTSQIGITTGTNPIIDIPTNITVENDAYGQYTHYFFSDNQAEYHTEYNSTYKRIVLAYGATEYTLRWDLNGGIASNTYTEGDTAYNSPIIVPEVTREGYTFIGWNPTAPPANMPANALSFEAIWEAIPEPEPQTMSMWIQGEPYSIYSAILTNGGTVNFNDETFYQIVMPMGYNGTVTLTTKSDTEDLGLDLYKKVDIEISEPLAYDRVAIIKCKMFLAEIEARGFTAANVYIYHFENGTWVKLASVAEVRDGIVYIEAETNTFSPFALGFENREASDTVPTDIDVVEPSQEPKSPSPILGILTGLGFVVAVKRRK